MVQEWKNRLNGSANDSYRNSYLFPLLRWWECWQGLHFQDLPELLVGSRSGRRRLANPMMNWAV